MAVVVPTLETEQALFESGCRAVIGCDEVGRGALAGPVTVAVALIDRDVGPFPNGLRDSKLLSEKRREAIAPLAAAWVRYSAIGEASAVEIDEIGIVPALALAGSRAYAALEAQTAAARAATLLLDGTHDWLSEMLPTGPSVVVRAKADRDCAVVAAASVIAKVHRDRNMRLAHETTPDYRWDSNKGYGSAVHLAALTESGASELHRRTWITGRA